MELAYQTPWWAQHKHLTLKTQIRNSNSTALALKRLHRLFEHLEESLVVRDKVEWMGHGEAWESTKHVGLTVRIFLFCVLVFSSKKRNE